MILSLAALLVSGVGRQLKMNDTFVPVHDIVATKPALINGKWTISGYFYLGGSWLGTSAWYKAPPEIYIDAGTKFHAKGHWKLADAHLIGPYPLVQGEGSPVAFTAE